MDSKFLNCRIHDIQPTDVAVDGKFLYICKACGSRPGAQAYWIMDHAIKDWNDAQAPPAPVSQPMPSEAPDLIPCWHCGEPRELSELELVPTNDTGARYDFGFKRVMVCKPTGVDDEPCAKREAAREDSVAAALTAASQRVMAKAECDCPNEFIKNAPPHSDRCKVSIAAEFAQIIKGESK